MYLDEVSGGIVGRDQWVFGACGVGDCGYLPVEYLSRQRVYLDTYFLPDIDVGDLGLLVIGRDPFVFISYEVGYRLSGLHVLSGL